MTPFAWESSVKSGKRNYRKEIAYDMEILRLFTVISRRRNNNLYEKSLTKKRAARALFCIVKAAFIAASFIYIRFAPTKRGFQ
jgi:hypothetical protein